MSDVYPWYAATYLQKTLRLCILKEIMQDIEDSDPNDPKTVTLCGSVKFRSYFVLVDETFTLKGWAVLQPGCWEHDKFHDEKEEEAKAQKDKLDRLFLSKISRSDLVFVINPGEYIRPSTRREIAFARSKDIPIKYLMKTEFKHPGFCEDCTDWIYNLNCDMCEIKNNRPTNFIDSQEKPPLFTYDSMEPW